MIIFKRIKSRRRAAALLTALISRASGLALSGAPILGPGSAIRRWFQQRD